MSKKKPALKPVTDREIQDGFNFLMAKINALDLKMKDGHDICPLHGFCKDGDQCFLERYMAQYPPPEYICSECQEQIEQGKR